MQWKPLDESSRNALGSTNADVFRFVFVQ